MSVGQKRILVIGGAGYIGSVCTELLVRNNYKVVVLDNLKTGHREAVHPRAEFIWGNFGNETLTSRLFKKYDFYCVVHFGGETLVGAAETDPELYFKNNLVNGLFLLKSLIKSNCRRIIFSSTAAVYGEPTSRVISEDHSKKPINAYGESKLMFEKVLKCYHSAYGLGYVVFRYFNASGASRRYGEDHSPETHLIPLLLQVSLGLRSEINIFGSDYDTPDGTCIRDYIHVLDIANAHMLALNKINKLSGSTFNLGTEHGFSVMEVVKTAEKVTSNMIPVKVVARRSGDPSRLVASSKKAKSELGWSQEHTTLEEIVRSAWSWQKRYPNGYKD